MTTYRIPTRPRSIQWSAPLVALAATSMAALASAQTVQTQLTTVKIPSAVKHAGTYHVSTGQWTRTGGATANFGPDVIYANTSLSGYFVADPIALDPEVIDEGGLPGITNPDSFAIGANRDTYSVNCFELAYCDLGAPGTSGWEMSFYDGFTPCAVPSQSPTAVINLTGLPANGCWTVAIDLSGGSEFCMAADAGQVGQSAPFGWSHRYIGTGGAPVAGFMLAGDPASSELGWVPGALPRNGFGTYYGGSGPCGATGYLTEDLITSVVGGVASCGGGGYQGSTTCGQPPSSPYASFYLEMQADVDPCAALLSSVYCQSNPNITGQIGQLEVRGQHDPLLNTATLHAFDLSPNQFGFFLTSPTQGFVANPAGSFGNLCLGGSIGRFVGSGQIKNSGPAGEMSLSTLANEWSLQAVPTPLGPYAVSAGVTTNFQLWFRDVGSIPASNFSNGVSVTW